MCVYVCASISICSKMIQELEIHGGLPRESWILEEGLWKGTTKVLTNKYFLNTHILVSGHSFLSLRLVIC